MGVQGALQPADAALRIFEETFEAGGLGVELGREATCDFLDIHGKGIECVTSGGLMLELFEPFARRQLSGSVQRGAAAILAQRDHQQNQHARGDQRPAQPGRVSRHRRIDRDRIGGNTSQDAQRVGTGHGKSSRLRDGAATAAVRSLYHRLMSLVASMREAVSSDRAVRRIVRSWRELTAAEAGGGEGGRRTLVACSGGADSSALALALSSATDELILGHVMHDLRPPDEARHDAERVVELGRRIGREAVIEQIQVAGLRGNVEANARSARYRALARLAEARGCRFVATGHHADDQLETVLMWLVRGAGPAALAGLEPVRSLGAGRVRLIRPQLAVTRRDCERICQRAGWVWSVDCTNEDTQRWRAYLRREVVPGLEQLRPGVARRVTASAALWRQAGRLIDARAEALLAAAEPTDRTQTLRQLRWRREVLRDEPGVVLGAMLRAAAQRWHGDRRRDRLTWRALEPVVRAIRKSATRRSEFHLAGLRVCVDAHWLEIGGVDNHA